MSEKPKDDNGLKVALNLLAESISLEQLYDLVIDEVSLEDIAVAINPKAKAELDEPDKLYEALSARLTNEEKKALLSFHNAWGTKGAWRQIASFYLGYAVALHFTGKIAR
jgi:hypothetical protein